MSREEGAVKHGSEPRVGRSEWFEEAGVGSVWEKRVAVESGRRYRLLYKALHLGNLIGWYFSMLAAGSY